MSICNDQRNPIDSHCVIILITLLAEITDNARRCEIIEILKAQYKFSDDSSIFDLSIDEKLNNGISKFLKRHDRLDQYSPALNSLNNSLKSISSIPKNQLNEALKFAINFIPFINYLDQLNEIAACTLEVPLHHRKRAIIVISNACIMAKMKPSLGLIIKMISCIGSQSTYLSELTNDVLSTIMKFQIEIFKVLRSFAW